jgi:hypothetical protein
MATVKEMQEQIEAQSQRIAELEAEVQRLRPRREAADVHMSQVDASFALPSPRQMTALWDAACRRLPAAAREACANYQSFALSLWYLGAGPLEIAPTLNEKVMPAYWSSAASRWLAQAGRPGGDIDVPSFMLACAAARVPYRAADSLAGVIPLFALCEGPRSPTFREGVQIEAGSQRLRNRWLLTLQTGMALEPTAGPKLAPPSPARVQLNITDAMKEQGVYWREASPAA